MSEAHQLTIMALPDPELDAQFYNGVPSKRLVAWIVDVVIVLIIGSLVTVAFGILTFGFGLFLFLPILLMTGIIYRSLTIAANSATWGMQFMGIELRGFNGHRFDLVQAVIHSTIFSFLMASFIGLILTSVCILTTKRGQGLPDLLLGSTAINRPTD